MAIMEIEPGCMETRISIKDDELKIYRLRTFFTYKGNMSLFDVMLFAFEQAMRYRVTEIYVVINERVGYEAYDHMANLVRGAGGFALVKPYKGIVLKA